MSKRILAAGGIFVALTTAAFAEMENKFSITHAEVSACQVDAMRLCGSVFPDQDAMLACMRSNRASLGTECGKVFDAGLKRRHL